MRCPASMPWTGRAPKREKDTKRRISNSPARGKRQKTDVAKLTNKKRKKTPRSAANPTDTQRAPREEKGVGTN